MKQYIGLSLSACIQDLVEGRLGNNIIVHAVICGSAFSPDNMFEEAFKHYSKRPWNKHSKEAYKAVFDAIPLFIQPRLEGLMPPNISKGRWIEIPTGV